MGAQTSTVGGQPTGQLGPNFLDELGKILRGGGLQGSAIGNIGDPAGITQKILAGIGDIGFDTESDFGKAFIGEQDRRRTESTANLNARFGAGGPGGTGAGLAFGTGAASLSNQLSGDLLRQDALALGELDQRARGQDLQALLGLSGQQFGFGSNILQQLGLATGRATPQAQTIQTPSFFQDFFSGLTGLAQAAAPFSPFG